MLFFALRFVYVNDVDVNKSLFIYLNKDMVIHRYFYDHDHNISNILIITFIIFFCKSNNS